MRKIIVIVMSLSSASFANPPKEVVDLKVRYQDAVTKATKPITDVYKQELMKLLQKFKNANDIDGIASVTEQLTQLGAPTEQVTTKAPDSNDDIDRFFVGKSWFSTANSEFHFDRDGGGYKGYSGTKLPLTWRKIENGIVEASSRKTADSPLTTYYFKFDNRKTALFGQSLNSIVDPLRSDK
jgi:hypothetical protein